MWLYLLGIVPWKAFKNMEEQLSDSCTVKCLPCEFFRLYSTDTDKGRKSIHYFWYKTWTHLQNVFSFHRRAGVPLAKWVKVRRILFLGSSVVEEGQEENIIANRQFDWQAQPDLKLVLRFEPNHYKPLRVEKPCSSHEFLNYWDSSYYWWWPWCFTAIRLKQTMFHQ